MSYSTEQLSPVKRALLELRKLRRELDEVKGAQSEPIAIIGMGLRLPGHVEDGDSFWQLLRDKGDAIVPLPSERWDMDAFYDPDPGAPGKMYTRAGGFLHDIDLFEPEFFGISPREADDMDPQQRLLVKVTWEALEHAGQAPDGLRASQTGVFVGLSNNDYIRMTTGIPEEIDVYTITGSTLSVAAGRLSYLLGLQGPSMVVDTACSSSLVSVHLACQSLRNNECNMALAGGVGLIISPEASINFSKAEMLAKDDRCKTFDSRADGYVRGEGCAMIVMKRLSDAIEDGDHILALVRGSAVNQDGRSSGLTAPNGPSQEAVIRRALANANVSPLEVQYVEAHGTGTSLGDPIEVQALAAVYGKNRPFDQPMAIGSVKTNLGHLEAAAGIAGLLKCVLALRAGEIPPHLHLQELNPLLAWDEMPLVVPTERTPWPASEGSRRAGVSSFGFSGTNAHVILEEAPELPERGVDEEGERYQVLTLSAHTELALRELVRRYEMFLDGASDRLGDIAYTSNIGRAHLERRLALVVSSVEEIGSRLGTWLEGKEPEGVFSGTVLQDHEPEIVFLFTGHGAQYVNMGRQLFETAPVFRKAIDACATVTDRYLDRPLYDVLFPGTDDDALLMERMTYAQPAVFALEYALAALWRSWGVEPTAVLGHSLGEYVAACIAGVFSLEDGLKLVCTRGRLMDSLPETGKMAVVFTSEETVGELLAPYADRATIGVINGPTSLVLSGEVAAVNTVVAALEAQGIKTRSLAVAQAAHSPLLDPILGEFQAVAHEVRYTEPDVVLISSMTGKMVAEGEVTNANYWRRQLRETVRFAAAIRTLYEENYKNFVEIGPHPTLIGMGQRCWPPELDGNLPEQLGLWLPSLREEGDDWQEMLESLAKLHVNGANVRWRALAANGADHDPYRRVPLPTNPWQEKRYWFRSHTSTPSVTPAMVWQGAVAAGQRQQQHGPFSLNPARYPQKWAVLADLSISYMKLTLSDFGFFDQPGDSHDTVSITSQAGIVPKYSRLVSRWLEHLTERGYLRKEADQFVCHKSLGNARVTEILDQAKRLLADEKPLLDYVMYCGDHLSEILTGKMSPLDTIFPEGGYETADFLYNQWSVVQYYNGIAAQIMGAVANLVPAERQIRILEIGAGTGGTTAALLPMLPRRQTRYHFTDVSDLFLARAQERFSAYPFVTYHTLNIEKPAQAQSVSQRFDVVVAANVLHATRNLDETLANVHQLLEPGGLLVLFEVTTHFTWFDITTGLIEGWGLYEDERRKQNPLLSPADWVSLLKSSGFAQVDVFPESEELADNLGLHIILAQAAVSEGNGAVFGGRIDPDVVKVEGIEVEPREDDEGHVAPAPSLRQQLHTALPDEQEELLLGFVRRCVARILRLPAEHEIEQRQRLMDMGVDSLMAVELRNQLQKGLALSKPIPATLIFDYPTIASVVTYLQNLIAESNESAGAEESTSAGSRVHVPEEALVSSLEGLSETEVEAMLLRKLDNL